MDSKKEKAVLDSAAATAEEQLTSDDLSLSELQGEDNTMPVVVCVSDCEEKEPEWLVEGLIPKGQITAIVGSGGVGKTTMLCKLIACLTNGIEFMAEDDSQKYEPKTVMYLSAEDSFEIVLKKKLRKMGADLSKIFTVMISDQFFSQLTFGSEILENVIKTRRPSLIIFDPIQSFFESNVRMAERNDVRRCIQTLIGYGTLYDTTSLLVVHTNKRSLAYGRDRMADSSDLWDASRSVLMFGETDVKPIRYMSHEKCNYGPLQQTVLFSISDQDVIFEGRSDKRDEEYVYLRGKSREKTAPAREEAKAFILQNIAEGPIQVGELKKAAKANGISEHTLDRAKSELKEEGVIKYDKRSRGQSKGVDWYVMFAIADVTDFTTG